jgi:hypothetical protein
MSEGSYRLEAIASDGRSGGLGPIVLAAGQQRRDLRLVVRTGATVHGSIADLDGGRPIDGARVAVKVADGILTTASDAAGRFRLEHVPGGRAVSIAVEVPGAEATPAELKSVDAADGDEVDAGTIRVLLHRRAGDLSGVGLECEPGPAGPVVVFANPGCSAGCQGIAEGDALFSIDDRDVSDLGPVAIGGLLEGPVSSPVQVGVRRAGSGRPAKLTSRAPAPSSLTNRDVERHAVLAQTAASRLAETGFTNVHVIEGDGTLGLRAPAPFDAIVVTAGGGSVRVVAFFMEDQRTTPGPDLTHRHALLDISWRARACMDCARSVSRTQRLRDSSTDVAGSHGPLREHRSPRTAATPVVPERA